MSDLGWAVLENVAILAAICFLVWLTESAWWALLVLGMNNFKITKNATGTDQK